MTRKFLLASVLLIAVVVAFIMIRKVEPWEDEPAVAGEWYLDEDTSFWMQRTCLDLVFDDTVRAGLTVSVEDEYARIRFNDVKRTALTGTYSGRALSARQVVQTSEVGRFCGAQTLIDVSWRIRRNGQDELVGAWVTPACDVCPNRRFRAVRAAAGGI